MKISTRIVAVVLFSGAMLFGLISPQGFFSAARASVGVEAYQQGTPPTPSQGETLYRQRCAVCHDSSQNQERIPPRSLFRLRAAEEVINALTNGVMRQQA